MNFLVTGAAGFIGSNLCERLLAEGHSVWGFDDLNSFYSPAQKETNVRDLSNSTQFHFIRGDLRDARAVEAALEAAAFDQIIHLAARAGACGTGRERDGGAPDARDGRARSP